jgi:hypothetical protein
MNIYVPYTYLIGWSNLDLWYYGVRTAKNCNPADLWVKYFTSSKVVKKLRSEHGEPNVLQIRKTFSDSKSALLWEEKVIRRLSLKSKKWLNIGNGGKEFSTAGLIPWNKGIPHNEETRKKISLKQAGTKRSVKHIESMMKSVRGKPKTEEHKLNISKANKGKKRADPSKCASCGFLGKKLSQESILKRTETRKRNREIKLLQNVVSVDSCPNI